MINFITKYPSKIYTPLLQHLKLTAITLVISLVIALIISILIIKSKILSKIVIGLFGAIYSIPSLALFAILIPLLGLGEKTTILVLVLYNQFILVRNINSGLNSVDKSILESAKGMGLSDFQILYMVRFPLASPFIIAGIRIAIVSTIGIATIASTINAGGLGVLLFDGLRTQNTIKILWGAILASALTILANFILAKVERKVQNKVTGEGRVAL